VAGTGITAAAAGTAMALLTPGCRGDLASVMFPSPPELESTYSESLCRSDSLTYRFEEAVRPGSVRIVNAGGCLVFVHPGGYGVAVERKVDDTLCALPCSTLTE